MTRKLLTPKSAIIFLEQDDKKRGQSPTRQAKGENPPRSPRMAIREKRGERKRKRRKYV